ncbi:E3 ubiquitin-protein ligase UPL6 [Acorus calamus]|uniref:HECT-type E3 ubiquitin transferase n=1 Tax=Acorus calamus TaxID=4465 RepID=A0AAV9CT84_ACOCL|nr:E3 ubiquitin-protein ligase UPL6 [Acorus calamus]
MFFSGDSSARKRVDLGGRSTKERDRKKLLEETHLERKRRMEFRQRNAAALTFQRILRGRSVVRAERRRMREEFRARYGDRCQNVDRHCFGPDSKFLPQLLFVFDEKNAGDFNLLVGACWKLRQFVRESGESGNIVSLLAGSEYMIKRERLKDQLPMSPKFSTMPVVILQEAVCTLIDPNLPWLCSVVGYLYQKKTYSLLREIILTGTAFSTQLSKHYVYQILQFLHTDDKLLPDDSGEFPGYACLLGNLLETAEAVLSQPSFTFDVALDFAAVLTFLLEELPPFKASVGKRSTLGDDEMYVDEESVVLNSDLETQISDAIDSKLPQQLVNALFRDVSLVAYPPSGGSFGADAAAVAAICGFLHALWQLLWVNPSKFPALEKSTINLLSSKKLSSEFIQYKVKNVVSELLSQLEDWNSRKPFTSASDFHVQEAIGENFISQDSNEKFE